MEQINVLDIADRQAFRAWLEEHGKSECECWVAVKRGKPTDDGGFWYIDAVEEALCFGWIDSTQKSVNGKTLQRFTPRKKKSPWTELNKERVRRLERLGLMTDSGRAVLPKMGQRSFKIPPYVVDALKQARVWAKFKRFPPLYQRVRAYNLQFCYTLDRDIYDKALAHMIEETKKEKMYGNWDDYGRLSEGCDPFEPNAEETTDQ